jgi:hypothetical protein
VTPNDIARVVLGLAFAIAAAVVTAHPRIQKWERSLGLSIFSASGFSMLMLGYAFAHFEIVTPIVVRDLRPVYEFALGWIGFAVGMQMNLERLDRLPSGLPRLAVLVTLSSMVFTALACGLALIALDVLPGYGFVRDVLVLSACAAVSAPANLTLLLRRFDARSREAIAAIPQLDQLAALAFLAILATLFRPPRNVGLWMLPRSGWFLVTLGIGFLLGVFVYLLIRRVHSRSQELSLVLGGIAMAAGAAGHLALSVPVIGALAGTVIANAPYVHYERLQRTLAEAERPIYLLILFFVGTNWRPFEWQGWVLGAVFAIARAYGKLAGARLAIRDANLSIRDARAITISLLPESAVAVVVIFSIATLHGETLLREVGWAINAVIVGSLLTESAVQYLQRREARAAGEDTFPTVSRFA